MIVNRVEHGRIDREGRVVLYRNGGRILDARGLMLYGDGLLVLLLALPIGLLCEGSGDGLLLDSSELSLALLHRSPLLVRWPLDKSGGGLLLDGAVDTLGGP